jgi:hypothetical protein
MNGRLFTAVFALIFFSCFYFFFWRPNAEAAREKVAALVEDPSKSGQGVHLPLRLRVVDSQGKNLAFTVVNWLGPEGQSGHGKANSDGRLWLDLPALGRYRLEISPEPKVHGGMSMGYRYKIGAERVELVLQTQAWVGS